jgi:glycosyltransferase involved in cell wall biosynthesis
VITDTEQHVEYFVKTFNLDKNKFKGIFVGADNTMFYPMKQKKNKQFTVFYYGSFLPLQGIEQVIKAAKILENKGIKFTVVGDGIEREKIMSLVKRLNVENINFKGWVKYKELPLEIAKGDICLGGHFSDIEKAKRVIAGKTYQYIAMKKPTIVGDNNANKELFTHKQNVYICSMNNAFALANAILTLRNNPKLREKIAQNGYRLFKEKCTPKILGKEIKEIAKEISTNKK